MHTFKFRSMLDVTFDEGHMRVSSSKFFFRHLALSLVNVQKEYLQKDVHVLGFVGLLFKKTSSTKC